MASGRPPLPAVDHSSTSNQIAPLHSPVSYSFCVGPALFPLHLPFELHTDPHLLSSSCCYPNQAPFTPRTPHTSRTTERPPLEPAPPVSCGSLQSMCHLNKSAFLHRCHGVILFPCLTGFLLIKLGVLSWIPICRGNGGTGAATTRQHFALAPLFFYFYLKPIQKNTLTCW